MIEDWALLVILISAANCAFGLIRTYYAIYAKKTYKGSVRYWESWNKRKYDVAAQALKEIGIDSPEEMRKLITLIKEKKKN